MQIGDFYARTKIADFYSKTINNKPAEEDVQKKHNSSFQPLETC